MADFCRPCTAHMFGVTDGNNDFAGWLRGMPGFRWALCEACGSHLIDDSGRKACVAEPDNDFGACAACTALGEIWADQAKAQRAEVTMADAMREFAAFALDFAAILTPARYGRSRVHGLAVAVQPQGWDA